MDAPVVRVHVGRMRVDGEGRRVRTYTRVSYTYDYNLQVINFLRESGSISATMARFFRAATDSPRSSHRKLINKWSMARDHIEARAAHHRTASQRRARPAGLGRVLPPTVEATLVKWINDLRRDGVPVSASMLRLQACDLAAEEGIDSSMFSASWQWRRSFMKLYRFSFRTKTHQGQEPPADALERAAEFVLKVGRTIAVEGISTIYNADQTAVNFELLPRTTLNATGRSTVWVRCGKKEKQRMATMLMGDSNGNKYPLFLIMKTTPSKIPSVQAENNRNRHGFGRRVWAEVERLQSEHGIQIFGNKTAWWTGALTVEFLRHHFGDRTPFSDPIMLFLNDFSGHWVKEAAAYAKTLRIVLEKVPPGLAWLCQPADCVWIKPVKDRLCSYWVAFLRQQLSLHRAKTAPAVFDMQPPSRATVTAWISSAWNDTTPATIRSGPKKCGLLATGPSEACDAEHEPESQESVNDVVDQLRLMSLLDCAYGTVSDSDDVVDGLP